MDRIHYAGHSIVTGTAIAEALLDYAQALAQAGGSATVEFPTRNDDGSRGRSEILLGPASQMISDAEDSEFEELTDEDLVSALRKKANDTRNHGMSSSMGATPAMWPDRDWSDLEL